MIQLLSPLTLMSLIDKKEKRRGGSSIEPTQEEPQGVKWSEEGLNKTCCETGTIASHLRQLLIFCDRH